MLSEVEVRRCRRLKSDAVGGPMLSEVEVRCCRRLKSDAVGGPMLSETQKSALVGFHNLQMQREKD